MPSFGPLLRRTREERGVSLDDIARETRLSKRYLTALEEEAIAKLPGGTYNRAYLRTYASFLGLDAERLLREYAAMDEGQSSPAEEDLLVTMNRAIESRTQTPSPVGSDLPGWSRLTGLSGMPSSIAVLVVIAAAVIGGAAWYAKFATTASAPASRTTPVPRVVSTAPERKAIPSKPPAAPVTTPGGTPSVIQVPAGRPDQRLRNVPPPAAAPARETSPVPAPPPPAVTGDVIARPSAQGAAALSHLSVTGSGVGTAVVDRQLVGKADRFAPGSRVIFWTHVVGGRTGDTIDHVWFRDGSLVGASSLSVGGADWRTQSRRVLDPPGEWAVEARDADGRVLARHEFHSGDQ